MAEVDTKVPEVGLRFKNPDEGWLFWVAYGGRTGFDVRKRCTNVSKMDGTHEPCEDKENIDPNVQQGDDLLSAAQLKKKEVQSNKSRRTRTWIDKLRKGKHNNPKSAKPKKKGVKVYHMQAAHLCMLL
uniref:Uncharacterized protein n=1 Tax=Oryza meridionalis TaxID=40149 RepID=A0A0E0ES51_9ORYZ